MMVFDLIYFKVVVTIFESAVEVVVEYVVDDISVFLSVDSAQLVVFGSFLFPLSIPHLLMVEGGSPY